MLLPLGDRDRRARSPTPHLVLVALALGLAMVAARASWAQGVPVTFSVIGDIPYSDNHVIRFQGFVADHNAMSPSEFFVHVGDIQAQDLVCPESNYVRAADIMRELAVPAFVLPGDNEWNDCGDPDAAWVFWERHLGSFEQQFCGTPEVQAQAVRPENFAFVQDRVLFIGLNLVGGRVHDSAEWALRMQQNADWVEQQLLETAGQVRAAVVLGQAERDNSRRAFFDRFDVAAAGFTRPILFVHGDGHSWIYDAVWGVPNLSRIQIEQGDPPLQITVTLDPQNPFVFTRDPWPAGTPVLNRAPCVDAGPDQVVALGQVAQLQGLVMDDGVPAPSVAVDWSQLTGPGVGQALLSDPASPMSMASFPEAGTYVLRLTASDGELARSDDVAIFVDSGEPYLSIAGATVVEGDSGTRTASFTVDLASASGAPVSVDYATLDETATAGWDYVASSGTLDFSGATVARTIDVSVVGDQELEDFESFRVVLSSPSGAVIANEAATGRILDDDIPRAPVVTSFLPARGPPGTVVAVAGEFEGVRDVSVGGAPASFTVLSSSALELVVPPDARTGPIIVTNATGMGQSSAAFGVEFPLTVAVIGQGSVAVDPPGGMQVDGSTVQLVPVPAPGWEFLVWGGAARGSAVPEWIQMTGATTVTAHFVETGSVIRIPWSGQPAAGSDDAEESVASGSVDLTSGDLELGVDVADVQIVGLRFPGVGIPQGAPIVSASVQFTVDESTGGAAELTIRGEAADHAAAFVGTDFDVSGRLATVSSVAWSPPAWTAAGDAGPAQRTPDLSALVQEIVDRPGWAAGNALVLTVAGSGTRTAESLDGKPASGARLDLLAVVDVAPPDTPANLRSLLETETSIELAWDASTDNLGVVAYRLYTPSGPLDLPGTTYAATGLAPDTEYVFQVTALDASGNESPPSAPLAVRTLPLDIRPPTVPANLRSPAQTGTTIDLAWDASSDDRGVAGYRVYRPSGPVAVAGTTFTATGLAPGVTYAFQVTAFDAAGNESLPTPLLFVTTPAPDREAPTTPANLRSPVQTSTRIDLAWDEASDDRGVTGYRLYRASGPIDLAGTTWSETGLVPGREYGFQVSALDAAGNESAPSPVLRVRTDRPPTTPANLRSPAQTETTIELAWDASSDDRGVVAYRLYTPGGPLDLPGTTFTATGLTPDTDYSFEIAALDTGGNESPPSTPLVVRTLEIDTQRPTTPANLRSPAQTGTTIELAWDASSDDRGVAGYRVHRASGSVAVAGTTFTATGLAPGVTYAFQVTAVDTTGNESLPTPLLFVTTPAPDGEPPSTPGNLRSPVQTPTRIDLAWDEASDDRGVTGYRLYRASGPIDLAGTTWSETGLVPGREYGFQVSALDAAGNESAPSPVLLVSTDGPPTTPANLRSPAQTETTIELAWDASSDDRGVVGYRLYTPSGPVDLPGTTFTATGLTPDTEYAFQVSAIDTAGSESSPSAPLVVRTLEIDTQPPTTPANLRSPAQTGTTIELAWDASSDDRGVVGYRIYRAGGPVDVAGTTFTATGLVPGDEYGFQVSALDAAGNESAPSPVLLVRTDAPPTAPANLRSPAQTETTIELAWDASSDDRGVVGYRVHGPGGPVDLPGTTFTATGLTPDTEYVFQVTALDAGGNESAPSAPLVVRTLEIDTQPPTTPANLRSPAQTETTIELAWDASSDDRGVAGYRVYGPGAPVDLPGTSLTVTGLAPGVTYAFQVTAVDTTGNESLPSPLLLVATTAPDTEPPTTPANLRSPVQTPTRIDLAWDEASDDRGVTGYRLYRESGPIDLAGTTWSETELVPGREYAFQVTAFDGAGNESAPSPVLLVSTDGPPTTPANLRSPAQTETTIELAWDASSDDRGVVGYRLYTPGGPVDLPGTTFTASGLTPDTEYAFQVSAIDTAGSESPPSAPLVVRTLEIDTQPPTTPANLRSPAQTESTIELAWDASSDDRGVVGYRVYGPGGAVDVPGLGHTETGLAPLTSYEFQVSALDAAGNESARSPLLAVSTRGVVARSASVRVSTGADDAEENVANGAVDLGSRDLEMTEDGATVQTIGMRFAGVGIPQGAPILSASVQFTADEVRTGPVTLLLHGEAADDAAPFTGAGFDVSGRAATASTVAWSPPGWTAIGDAGAAQRTPDLSALVQEIVDRPGWTPGNALVLVVSGSGTRTAESFEGVAAAAPLLEIVYLGEPDTQPPTTPGNLRSPAQTETSIDLAWDEASDDDGVVGYRVYGAGGPMDVAGTTWTATGLAPGTEYAFQVSALDAAGNESLPSAVLLVSTVAPDVQAPTAPPNLRSIAQTASRIELAWDASSDDRGVVGYRVYGPLGAIDVLGLAYTATGLAPLTAYDFQVSALDAAGNESLPSPVLRVSTTDTEILVVQVQASLDDVEENVATGGVNQSSGDLELGVANTTPQAVGLHFADLAIPQGAEIVSASVQFTADEVRTGAVALVLHAEAVDDAAPFTGVGFDVSSRIATLSTVAWSPPDWTAVGDAGAAQRTPDLSALLQEIVDRAGWTPGNALVLVVSGTGTRTAESFDGAPAAAPVLHVEFRVGPGAGG